MSFVGGDQTRPGVDGQGFSPTHRLHCPALACCHRRVGFQLRSYQLFLPTDTEVAPLLEGCVVAASIVQAASLLRIDATQTPAHETC
jgi:hypothetical protein